MSGPSTEQREPTDEGATAPVEGAPPPQPPILTVRAIVAGLVLSLVLAAVNSYLTLSFGVIEEGPTIAALFFFAFFFLSRTRIVSSEMAMVATLGSAGGSLGFITNFFAAEAMTGEPYTFAQMVGFSVVSSLVGLAFAVPLRELLILREDLPWPGSKATESVIRALVEAGDPKQPRYLLIATLSCIAIVVLNDEDGFGLIPSGTAITLFGLSAFGAGIAWSPFAIGGAYLMGFRVCVGFFVGGLVLLFLAPHLPTPSAPHRYVWPGIGFLVASGLVQMFLNWRVIRDAVTSIFGASQTVDDDPIMGKRSFVIFTIVALVCASTFAYFALGLSVILIALLIVVAGFLQNIIATRAAAQTAFNPARVMGVLLQGITSAAGARTAAANLAGAGFVAGSGAQAGTLTGDFAYGRALGVPSRWQFWAQFSTILPCSIVAALVFTQIQAQRPLSLEGDGLPAPVAKMWAATALIFEGRTEMPPFAWQAMGLGALAGAIYVLLEKNEAIAKWLPHSIGVGIGLVLPIAFDWAFFVGGVVLWIVMGRWLRVRDVTLTTIAVGSIVGEGIGGVLKPILSMLGVITHGG